MSEDNLLKACAMVGRFLYEFALVEREIDEGIAKILDLKGGAADVVAGGVDFARKANLLRTVVLETAVEEKAGISKLFSTIFQQNDNRVFIAHSTFEPAADEAVQFRRTVARDGKIKKHDPLWTKEKFEASYKCSKEIRDQLTKLRPRLTIIVGEEGKTEILSHYLYTSGSTCAPPGGSS